MQGFININKPSGVTSAYVVSKIKKQFHINKIGHMGTLDPLASGVLIIAVGKATRLFDYVLEKSKQYVAVFEFGYETDTLDSEGVITRKKDVIPNINEVNNAIKRLVGKQDQLPPKFSAKKINGRKAYELARNNEEFTLKPKEIEIYSLKLLEQVNEYSFKFEITCSSGTYIRSIARDLGELLNTYATMTYLQRTQTGKFNINDSTSLDNILLKNSLTYDIIEPEDVLNYTIIKVNNEEFTKLKNGIALINFNYDNGSYFIKNENILLGIGEVNNKTLKIKTFLLED